MFTSLARLYPTIEDELADHVFVLFHQHFFHGKPKISGTFFKTVSLYCLHCSMHIKEEDFD